VEYLKHDPAPEQQTGDGVILRVVKDIRRMHLVNGWEKAANAAKTIGKVETKPLKRLATPAGGDVQL
jgi:hypothetical protein